MSNRQDQEREAKLQPVRINKAVKEIQIRGYGVILETKTCISFMIWGEKIRFFPYSGWHTGKGIKDGRGLENLLKQL